MGRQYTPLPRTPMKNLPSKRGSRDNRAREQTRQSRATLSTAFRLTHSCFYARRFRTCMCEAANRKQRS